MLVDARQSAEFLGVVKQICGVANETENTESGEAADNGEGMCLIQLHFVGIENEVAFYFVYLV